MQRQWQFLADAVDVSLCRWGVIAPASWQAVQSGRVRKLYAGRLSRSEPQFGSFLGLTPYAPSRQNICHDLESPFPLESNSVEVFQSQDVFEHIACEKLPDIINEIYRALKPGGLFRLSLPDYRADVYRDRTLKDDSGSLIFDPGGGGAFVDGRVVGGGHLWFPDHEKVQALFAVSAFSEDPQARVNYLHFNGADGRGVLQPIDYSKGYIRRTPDHDNRVAGSGQALSIVVDAVKGAATS
jgi:SAM-dependent methyltransferase